MKLKLILGAIATLFALSTLYVVSASKDDYTPTEALEKYYEAARNGEIEEASKYVASEVLDIYESGKNPEYGTLSAAIVREGKKFEKITPIKEKITGETATVTVKLVHEGGEYKTEEDYLIVKEEDGWKLTFQ